MDPNEWAGSWCSDKPMFPADFWDDVLTPEADTGPHGSTCARDEVLQPEGRSTG